MATGRTAPKHARFYMDGYDLSGHAIGFGPLTWEYEGDAEGALSDGVKSLLPGLATISVGELNGFFDNTAVTGLHIVASSAGVKRTVMAPIGIRGALAQADPVFVGEFEQLTYHGVPEGTFVTANVGFGQWDATAGTLLYDQPWGVLLHPNQAETAVNTAIGVDDTIAGAATTKGGYLCYQGFAGNGTATVKVQDAATNLDASFADLAGATTGSLDWSTRRAGLVAIGKTVTVRRFLRWQIVLGTATTLTFALGFVRGK